MNLEEVFKKVIFLIGAGASKDAGCQLSKDMLTGLENSINDINTSDSNYFDYKEDFYEVYWFILASLRYQLTLKGDIIEGGAYLNIEDFVMVLRQLIDKEFIIPYPLIGNWNDKILKWELHNKDIFKIFKNFISFQLINIWTKYDQEKAINGLQPLRELLNISEKIKINIFSLNYDLIFENVFNTTTAKILDNGFSEKNISNNKIRYWANDFSDELNPTKINLYKLHGSLDWEYNGDTEEISIKDNIYDGNEPLIIFGSYSKMLSFDPFLYILSHFRELLEKSTILVAIGYSFHDKYINNLIIQQLSQNTDEGVPKKLIIVDPRGSETENQFAEDLKNIQDSKSINDVINFSRLNSERIKLIRTSGFDFFKKYFSDYGKELIEELLQTEESYKPFG